MKWVKLFPIFVIVFALNIIWEFCHYSLYIDLTGISSTLHLILAAFVDVILIALIFLIISIKNKKSNWIMCPKEKDCFLVIILGLIIAFIWEFANLYLGRWIYTYEMPLFFGVGLSPLLQLAITAILSLCVFNYLNYNKKS